MALDKSKYHGLNEVIEHIYTGLRNTLNSIESDEKWQVVRANQPTIQALQNNTVYFDIVSKRRYGVQGTKPVKIDQDWCMESVWYEELLVQVSAFKQRDPDTDSTFTLSSSDVIGMLQGLVNSSKDMDDIYLDSLQETSIFQADWVNVIRSTDIREIEFETDSGLKEKFPQFDFLLVVEQRLLKNMEKIDTIELETKRI